MASQEGSSQTINLKVLIDKKKNRVIMAEADSDFVDILLSFLTMPMGTIVRLIRKNPEPAIIGSLTSLYKEVENLQEQFLQSYVSKSMLLHPRNPSETWCRKLKLNIDDTKFKYYICGDWISCCRIRGYAYYSIFKNITCDVCRKMMDKVIYMGKEEPEGDGEVFVCGLTKFMVTDDLHVEPMSPGTMLTLLHKLGIKDTSSIQENTLSIGSEEILNLLKGSLCSETPLTDVFLRKQGVFTSEDPTLKIGDALQSKSSGSILFRFPRDMSMKLTMSKSMNKASYAEAGEDMGNFLLSILTLPLGSILQLLYGNSSLGSMDNLYKSVECSKVTRDDCLRDLLLHPGLCGGFYNPLGVNETNLPHYLWCTVYENPQNKDKPYTVCLTTKQQSNCGRTSQYCHKLYYMSPTSETTGRGFLKGPATFLVADNLAFIPLISMWSLSLLKIMKGPLDDFEVRMVNVGEQQALKLLKSSLLTKSVLTDVFINIRLKSPKQEK